jgi:hypothetical protein
VVPAPHLRSLRPTTVPPASGTTTARRLIQLSSRSARDCALAWHTLDGPVREILRGDRPRTGTQRGLSAYEHAADFFRHPAPLPVDKTCPKASLIGDAKILPEPP